MSAAAEDAAVRAALSLWFGIPRGSCTVLCALYRAGGRPLTAAALAGLAMTTRKSVVNHHLHFLRQSLTDEAIDFEPDVGYWLTPEGVAECRQALRRVGAELRRAS
jgi:hypothetical protein